MCVCRWTVAIPTAFGSTINDPEGERGNVPRTEKTQNEEKKKQINEEENERKRAPVAMATDRRGATAPKNSLSDP